MQRVSDSRSLKIANWLGDLVRGPEQPSREAKQYEAKRGAAWGAKGDLVRGQAA
jgi:hypothetical protein